MKQLSNWPIIALVLLSIVLIALEWLLFELQRMPYRPPVDMSTLLGGSEIKFVRLIMALLPIPWLLCSIVLFQANSEVRRRRRIKRGLCPACAYPIGTSLLCTECGKAVIEQQATASHDKASASS